MAIHPYEFYSKKYQQTQDANYLKMLATCDLPESTNNVQTTTNPNEPKGKQTVQATVKS